MVKTCTKIYNVLAQPIFDFVTSRCCSRYDAVKISVVFQWNRQKRNLSSFKTHVHIAIVSTAHEPVRLASLCKLAIVLQNTFGWFLYPHSSLSMNFNWPLNDSFIFQESWLFKNKKITAIFSEQAASALLWFSGGSLFLVKMEFEDVRGSYRGILVTRD